MFTLFILAQTLAPVTVSANKPAPEPDCRAMMILSGISAPASRDAPNKAQRDRTKKQEQQRTSKPCLVLANV